ncbi:MAG: hypothetical protein K8I30_11960, partial [Anaerolineae bacterium]|nr:hypothetical protein [Anaerolineae bacterium]
MSISSILLLALVVTACGVGLNVKQDEQGNTILDVSLPESVVNQVLQSAVVNDQGTTSADANEILTQIDSVDMKPGLITVTGKRTMPDGTLANGVFDVSLSAENGQLKASVSNVHVEGMEVTEAAVNRINERIATELAKSASSDDKAEITSV